MSTLDRIFEIVQKNGPTLPVEVASRLRIDSMLANAYLSQLAESGKVKTSKEKLGGTFLYFMPGQEDAASKRAQSLIAGVKKTLKMYQKDDVRVTPEMQQKRTAFAERLKEIETKEKAAPKLEPQKNLPEKIREHFIDMLRPSIDEIHAKEKAREERIEAEKAEAEQAEEIKEQSKPKAPVRETQAKVEKKIAPKEIQEKNIILPFAKELVKVVSEIKEEPKPELRLGKEKLPEVPAGDFVQLALKHLSSKDAIIASQSIKKKGKEADVVAEIPSNFGPIKMLVVIRDKKTINEADLSLAYTEGQTAKLPVLLLTNGKLTKNAQSYLKVISGLLKVMSID